MNAHLPLSVLVQKVTLQLCPYTSKSSIEPYLNFSVASSAKQSKYSGTVTDNQSPPVALSKYPMASLRELITLAFPIIFVLVCTNLASFCDRLLLSRYSLEAFEGCVSASFLCMLFQVPCIRLASIAQVFVGKQVGEGDGSSVGQYVWQMIWFSLLSLVIILPAGLLLAPVYFSETSIERVGMVYFKGMLYAHALFPLGAALSSFFMGIGKTRFIVYAMLLSQIVHFSLALLLIFGVPGVVPPLGILGAVIALITSQGLFCITLLGVFFKKAYRRTYGTWNYRLKGALFYECLKVGLPSALGKLSALLAWVAITKIMIVKGDAYLTVLSVGSTLTLIIIFINDGLGRAVTTVASYIIGAGKWVPYAAKLGRSTLLFLGLFSLIFLVPFVICPDMFSSLVFPSLPREHLSFIYPALFWIWIYALTNGISFLGIGLLTATRQTFFYMVLCQLTWITYGILLRGIQNGNWPPERLWCVMALESLIGSSIQLLWVRKKQAESIFTAL